MKEAVRTLARHTVGRLPRSPARLTGPLAIEGGTPVRDVRLRPWRHDNANTRWRWIARVGPALRDVFVGGREGLPQARQKEFAAAWAAYCGCRHGLMLPHGTDALRLGLAAMFDHDGLDYGGELLVPNLSFVASATAPLDRRFGVALVDVDPETLNVDPKALEAAIVPGKTRGIVPVHQFGAPADMTAIRAIADKHGLKVMEDAAQAHGATWETGPAGSLGDAAAFSFQSAKNLACGEGGILTTNDSATFERAHALHNAGRSFVQESRWEHATLGWNVRATEYQAALLLDRLRDFDALQSRRAANFTALRELLADVGCVRPLAVDARVRKHGMYMFVMRYVPERCGGLPLERFLAAAGAEGAPLYRCYSTTIAGQEAFRRLAERRPEYVRVLDTPVSDRAAQEIVYIAASVFLAERSDMEEIAAALRKVGTHYASHPWRGGQVRA